MLPNKRLFQTVLTLAALLAFVLSACTFTAETQVIPPTQDLNAIYTQAAATISVQLTQTEQAKPTVTPVPPTATLEPTLPPQPSPTLGATPTPEIVAVSTSASTRPTPTVDTAAAHGCYNATLLMDVTVPYAANYKQGDKFTKTWRVQNTGSCDWNRGFLLVFLSGDAMSASTTTIDQKVAAGGITEISLVMIAPTNGSGLVYGNWQIANELGKTFGSVLGVAITLPAISASSSSGCYDSALISKGIADGTDFNQSESFTQTWTVKNTGTCEWESSFTFTWVGGDMLGSDTTKIRRTVGPGSTTEFALDFKAPSTSGQVTSSWQLYTNDGTAFGQVFGVTIDVK